MVYKQLHGFGRRFSIRILIRIFTMTKAINYRSDLISGILTEISADEQEKTDKRMQLAARIYDGITAKGWNKSKFAEAMKKRPSEITKWLSGTHNFETDTLFDIEKILGIRLVNLHDERQDQVFRFYFSVSEKVTTNPKRVVPWYTGITQRSNQKILIPDNSVEIHNFEYQS